MKLGTKRNKIFVEDPHITSRAAYILLKHRFEKQLLEEWEVFRNAFFDKHGEPLTCFYCGKTNLVREVTDSSNKKQLETLATVDHIVALANGGQRYDEDNCVVACHPCNSRKRNKEAGTKEFIDFIRNRIRQNKHRLSNNQIKSLECMLELR